MHCSTLTHPNARCFWGKEYLRIFVLPREGGFYEGKEVFFTVDLRSIDRNTMWNIRCGSKVWHPQIEWNGDNKCLIAAYID